MKKMLKIWALVLALVIGMTLLSACGNGGDGDGTDTDGTDTAGVGTDTAGGDETDLPEDPEAAIKDQIKAIRRINETDIEILFTDKYDGGDEPRASIFRASTPDDDRLGYNLDYGYGGAVFFDDMLTLSLAEPLPTDDTAPKLTITYEDVTFDVPYEPYYIYETTAKCGVKVYGGRTLLTGEETVKRAAELVDMILAKSQFIADQMAAGGAKLVVYGPGEHAFYIPEHRSGYDEESLYVEGFGGYTCSITEANVWHWTASNPGPDKNYTTAYVNENILVHEFCHGVKIAGLDPAADSTLATEFQMVYRHAKAAGLWPDSYAISNSDEFFATLSAIWFNVMNESNGNDTWDGVRGPINTRDELYNYDRVSYNFFAKIYPFTDLDGAWTPVPDTVKVTGNGTEKAVDMTGNEVTFAYPDNADSIGIDYTKMYKIKFSEADFIVDTSSGDGLGLWWDYGTDYPDGAGAMHYTFEEVEPVKTENGKLVYTVYMKSERDGYIYYDESVSRIYAAALMTTVPEEPTVFTIKIDGTGLAQIFCEGGVYQMDSDIFENGTLASIYPDAEGDYFYIMDLDATTNYMVFVHDATANDSEAGVLATEGETVTIKAPAELDGKTFAGWTVSGAEAADASANETTITVGTTDVVVWANYQ